MRRIFLIGYMGAGKTTIGKELSKQSGLSFIDLDHFMEGRYRKTVRQIFEEKGEEAFRQIEKKALHEVADFENVVISTGGGTPCFFDNMAYMNSIGTTVYLKASPQSLSDRLEHCRPNRPLLKGLSGAGLTHFVKASLTERAPFYEQAHITFDVEVLVTENHVTTLASKLQEMIDTRYP